jgi:hypothetical protein
MKSIECFFMSSNYLICRIYSNNTCLTLPPIKFEGIKAFVERLYEDLKK